MATATGEPIKQWVPVIHIDAKLELGTIPPNESRQLQSRVKDVATREVPTNHRSVKQLTDTDLFRIRAGKFRAICDHRGAEIRVLLVDHRKHAYTRLEEAEARQKDQ